jgi:hypothetical protein
MQKRRTKIGDVFSVKIDNQYKKYFQLVAFDLTQLNSDVIRAFKLAYPIHLDICLSEIVTGEVDFYAHCITKSGLNLKIWEFEGNFIEIGDTSNIIFRNTNDYGKKAGDAAIEVSMNWHIWRINDDNFLNVGKLEGVYKNAEIGIVVTPQDIVDRMKTGKYNFVYPGFE